MSPELLGPDRFGTKSWSQKKGSDSYSFGMVILEVLTGDPPFKRFSGNAVMRMVLGGKWPERQLGWEGALFTDDLWSVLNRCWETQPGSRPGVEAILGCLERSSKAWKPISARW